MHLCIFKFKHFYIMFMGLRFPWLIDVSRVLSAEQRGGDVTVVLVDAFHIIEIDQNNISLDAFQVFVEEVYNLEYLAYTEVFLVINQKIYFLKGVF